MSITVKTADKTTAVFAPFNPDFPAGARALGGKWNPGMAAWTFDARDESRVRDLCRSVYGTDGEPASGDLVTIRIKAVQRVLRSAQGIYFAGRCIASARGRDTGARLGEGVILLSGRAYSGGSVKNWTTEIKDGSEFEVKDVPRAALETEKENSYWEVSICDETARELAELQKEKFALQVRLDAVNDAIKQMQAKSEGAA